MLPPINICSQFSEDNDLTFNPNKSMCMVMKPRKYKLSCPSVYIDTTEISYVDTAKYLGVIISHDLSDDTDMKRQLRSLYAKANTPIRKFTKCSLEVKLTLFKSYCTSTYCSHLWANYSKASLSKLRVAYNNVYRHLLGYKKRDSASMMLVGNGVDSFPTINRKYVYRFMNRVVSSSNAIVKCLSDNYTVKSSTMWMTWNRIVYVC